MPPPITRPSRWLIDALTDEQWYQDVEPTWDSLPTSAQAQADRAKRARLLRKHKLHALSIQLGRCAPRARCFSGSCPECGRAFQRYIAAKASELLVPHTDYAVASVVGRKRLFVGEISRFDIVQHKDRLSRALERGRVLMAIGGVDFSLNEYPGKTRPSRWKPHLYLLIHASNRERWERILRVRYIRTGLTPRPIVIKSWNGSLAAPGYALKTDFVRRIAISTDRYARGKYRRCNNTRDDRLRSIERAELYSYLHEIGLEARLFLFGVTKVEGGLDVVL